MAKTSARERFLVGSELTLFAQQKQTGDGERNADKSLPRQRFMKKQNPGDRHDRCATGQNCGNRRERPAFLKKKEKRNRSRAHANARNQRIIKTGSAEFLIPFFRRTRESPNKSGSTVQHWLRQRIRPSLRQCGSPRAW